MSEDTGAEDTSSQTSVRRGDGAGAGAASSSADRGATPADLLAAGKAIDELLAVNDGSELAKSAIIQILASQSKGPDLLEGEGATPTSSK